jgi:hypothetical protein
LVLMPEAQTRRALRDHPLRLRVLAPVGQWFGCGVLRVLRIMNEGETIELTVGYESYQRAGSGS